MRNGPTYRALRDRQRLRNSGPGVKNSPKIVEPRVHRADTDLLLT